MMEASLVVQESELDRVRELTNIGAGHAATAFAALVGRPCRMRVPTVRLLRPDAAGSAFVASSRDDERGPLCGIFFEVEGGVGGILALLFPAPARDVLLRALAGESVSREAAESALREVGNILISHAVSAIADTLGTRVLPSIPVLAMDDAASALASLVALRGIGGGALRIETEISDAEGEFRGLLVFVPDAACLARPEPERRGPVRVRPLRRSES
jgi:chemotaxis protein CheC